MLSDLKRSYQIMIIAFHATVTVLFPSYSKHCAITNWFFFWFTQFNTKSTKIQRENASEFPAKWTYTLQVSGVDNASSRRLERYHQWPRHHRRGSITVCSRWLFPCRRRNRRNRAPWPRVFDDREATLGTWCLRRPPGGRDRDTSRRRLNHAYAAVLRSHEYAGLDDVENDAHVHGRQRREPRSDLWRSSSLNTVAQVFAKE